MVPYKATDSFANFESLFQYLINSNIKVTYYLFILKGASVEGVLLFPSSDPLLQVCWPCSCATLGFSFVRSRHFHTTRMQAVG